MFKLLVCMLFAVAFLAVLIVIFLIGSKTDIDKNIEDIEQLDFIKEYNKNHYKNKIFIKIHCVYI